MKESLLTSVVYFVGGCFLGAFIIQWYNYIYLQVPGIHYWQYYVLAFLIGGAVKLNTLFGYLVGLVCITALILQICSWFGLITLPLKHYFH